MENIKLTKGIFKIASSSNGKHHAEYRQGYLFTYKNIKFGVHKTEFDHGHTRWNITHINSGLSMGYYTQTRTECIEKLPEYIHYVEDAENTKKFPPIDSYVLETA